jgi:hypothetical protein
MRNWTDIEKKVLEMGNSLHRGPLMESGGGSFTGAF